MVLKTVTYTCEICKQNFPSRKEAAECEVQGADRMLPVGTIFSNGDDNMVFAIVECLERELGHHHAYKAWGCRDTNAGDNTDDKYCGFHSWDIFYPPNKNLSAYHRMVSALKRVGIKPLPLKKTCKPKKDC